MWKDIEELVEGRILANRERHYGVGLSTSRIKEYQSNKRQ